MNCKLERRVVPIVVTVAAVFSVSAMAKQGTQPEPISSHYSNGGHNARSAPTDVIEEAPEMRIDSGLVQGTGPSKPRDAALAATPPQPATEDGTQPDVAWKLELSRAEICGLGAPTDPKAAARKPVGLMLHRRY